MTQSVAEGVLLVAHGTVTDMHEMEAFLTAIRRGRPPTAELVDEMRRRYAAIGGSPLLATTTQQAQALATRLGKPVVVGMRFGRPSIEEALTEAHRLGIKRLVVLPMAPYSVSLYFSEVRARRWAMPPALGDDELELLTIGPWGTHPDLVRAHADAIRTFASAEISTGAAVVLSAHSLPMRVIEIGDSYAREVRDSAAAVARELGVPVELAFQSQGADGGRWLGPELSEVVTGLAARGVSQVVVAPFGFLCDHVETLFDLDIELKTRTNALGIALSRVPALGLHTGLIDALADLAGKAQPSGSEVLAC